MIEDISLMQLLLTTIVPSIVSGATVALLTVPIAFGKFRKERLWERRLQAYADVLNALSYVRRYSREALAIVESQKRLNNEALGDLAARADEGRENIRRAAAIAALVLDPQGAAQLEQLESDLDNPYYNLDLHEQIEADLELADSAYNEIRAIAKRATQGSRFQFFRGRP